MKDVLDTQITIPVYKPTLINQCGTWSTVYPAEYNKEGVKHNGNIKNND